MCDGAITNMSESIMTNFGVGQDEFIFRLYSIALVAIGSAAMITGDVTDGLVWMFQPGTYAEQQSNVPLEDRTWSSMSKLGVMILFSTMGFFGSSCSAAITKNFGALAMSVTSTARKATTLFLSFLLFDNACTLEHIVGIAVFIVALLAKSMKRGGKQKPKLKKPRTVRRVLPADLELAVVGGGGEKPSRQKVHHTSSFDSMDSFGQRSTGVRERRNGETTSPAVTPRSRNSDTEDTKYSPKVRYHVV
jgi:UAA transporter family